MPYPQNIPNFTNGVLVTEIELDKLGDAIKHLHGDDSQIDLVGNIQVLRVARAAYSLATSGVLSKGRLWAQQGGVTAITENLWFDGTNWNLDDTSLPGWLIQVNAAGDQVAVWRASAGANPRSAALSNLLVVSNTGNLTVTGSLNASAVGQAWQTPTLVNSWANVAGWLPAGYFKDAFQVVHLRGHVGGGNLGTAVFTLPVGYRPSVIGRYPGVSSQAFASIEVDASGNVIFETASHVGPYPNVALNGITFRAD